MSETKPWYLSRTIWASIVTVLTAMASLSGVPTGAIDNAALTETILQSVTAVSGLVAIIARVFADSRIG